MFFEGDFEMSPEEARVIIRFCKFSKKNGMSR